jgi:hypothetical protein
VEGGGGEFVGHRWNEFTGFCGGERFWRQNGSNGLGCVGFVGVLRLRDSLA